MRRFRLTSFGLVLLGLAACKARDEAPVTAQREGSVADASASSVSYMPVAAQLATRNLGVKPGELVLVAGTPEHIRLLEDIALQVRKAGGWPVITVGSERLTRLSFDSIPAERDADVPQAELALAKTFPAMIALEGAQSDATLRHVAPERFEARAKAGQPIVAQINRLNRRIVFLGNGMFPTEERARQQGVTREELDRLFWEGVSVDPQAMAAAGEAVKAALRSGRTVRITSPAGTDLTLALAGNEPYFSDGAITAEDAKSGPQAQTVWLPAGEVYVRVAPGSANGTIVADRLTSEGEDIEGLRLDVKDGRVTSLSAAKGLERFKTRYDAASAGKDVITVLDIGVNPNMTIATDSKLRTFAPSGMVTVFVGNDTWAGGQNNASLNVPMFLTGAQVTIDGKPIVEAGKLVLVSTAM
jgi:leucyl aminopeptidase (aminopeptidase T)